jgi:hypothetical protein
MIKPVRCAHTAPADILTATTTTGGTVKTTPTLACARTARHAKRPVVRIAAVALACWLVTQLAAVPANAQSLAPSGGTAASTQGIFDSTCDGAASTKIVKIYINSNDLAVILRCGTSTWGYRHIDQRRADGFNNEIDEAIETTLALGARSSEGTAVVYWFHGFRVVYETKLFNDGIQQGIITAYL